MRTGLLLTNLVLGICGGGVAVAAAAERVGSPTQLGVRSSASVKDVLVDEYDYVTKTRATLTADTQGFDAGEELTSVRGSGMTVFCGARTAIGLGMCLGDSDGDGAFDHRYIRNASNRLAEDARLRPPVPYRLSETMDDQAYKYELVYLGTAKGKAKFGYREYVDDFERPVFRQDLTYTLDPGDTTIQFLAVLLTIHSATKKQIEYTVHKGFDLDNHR